MIQLLHIQLQFVDYTSIIELKQQTAKGRNQVIKNLIMPKAINYESKQKLGVSK